MDEARRKSVQSLRPAADWALFLDADGTILHLRDTPDSVQASAHLLDVLELIARRLNGAVALVSGRSIDDLDRIFVPHKLPTAGLHGLERRDAAGHVNRFPEPHALQALRGPLNDIAGNNDGVLVEDKSHALAVHYRKAPAKAFEIRKFVEDLIRPLAHELHVIHGKMVSEIKPKHADKGSAIRDFMNEPPFTGRVPVFIGDDTTDEDGFAYVNQLHGYAIRVGASENTAAPYSLGDVDEVIAWLESWPASLQQQEQDIIREQP